MHAHAPIRAHDPFRGQIVAVNAQQAAILHAVHHVLETFGATTKERGELARKEWKKKPGASILGELEMFDNEVSGAASWCAGTTEHPHAKVAIHKIKAFHVDRLSRRLQGYPNLQAYLNAIAELGDLVVNCLEHPLE